VSATSPPTPRVRAPVVVALLAVTGVVMALLLAGGGDDSPTSSGPAASTGPSRSVQGPRHASEGGAKTPAAPPPAPSTSGAELNDQGYALIQAGRYEEAVPVLQ